MINEFLENLKPEKFFDSLNPETTDSFKHSVTAWGIAIFGLIIILILFGLLKKGVKL